MGNGNYARWIMVMPFYVTGSAVSQLGCPTCDHAINGLLLMGMGQHQPSHGQVPAVGLVGMWTARGPCSAGDHGACAGHVAGFLNKTTTRSWGLCIDYVFATWMVSLLKTSEHDHSWSCLGGTITIPICTAWQTFMADPDASCNAVSVTDAELLGGQKVDKKWRNALSSSTLTERISSIGNSICSM